MFNKSFTCTVMTDGAGRFEASTPVEGSHLFAVHAKIQATLLSPLGTNVNGTFAIGSAAAKAFSAVTNETVDLGSWQISKGANTAKAEGETSPAHEHAQLVVRFDASL